jgi:hypothetical protein
VGRSRKQFLADFVVCAQPTGLGEGRWLGAAAVDLTRERDDHSDLTGGRDVGFGVGDLSRAGLAEYCPPALPGRDELSLGVDLAGRSLEV